MHYCVTPRRLQQQLGDRKLTGCPLLQLLPFLRVVSPGCTSSPAHNQLLYSQSLSHSPTLSRYSSLFLARSFLIRNVYAIMSVKYFLILWSVCVSVYVCVCECKCVSVCVSVCVWVYHHTSHAAACNTQPNWDRHSRTTTQHISFSVEAVNRRRSVSLSTTYDLSFFQCSN